MFILKIMVNENQHHFKLKEKNVLKQQQTVLILSIFIHVYFISILFMHV